MDSKLSKKAQRNHAKELEPFEQDKILSEDDPRIEEAIERMGMLDMDEMYAERQLQKAFQEVIEADLRPSKYSPKDRLRAAMAYITTGSTIRAGELCGISHNTIRAWKAEARWWPIAVEYARMAKKEETSAKLGELQDLAMHSVEERLRNGDEVVNMKTGQTYRKAVSAKDAMWIVTAAQDKKAILNGEATRITETRSQEAALENIANKLEQIIKNADPRVIEGIVIEKG